MPSENTTGILVAVGLLVLALVAIVLNGLADSVSRLLYSIGVPAQYAADINSVVFFGGLFLLIVLVLKALPRLSRA